MPTRGPKILIGTDRRGGENLFIGGLAYLDTFGSNLLTDEGHSPGYCYTEAGHTVLRPKPWAHGDATGKHAPPHRSDYAGDAGTYKGTH